MSVDVDALVRALESRWPQVKLSSDAARAFLAQHAASPHLDDLALAWACLDGQGAALEHFDAAHVSQVDRWLQKVEPSPDVRDEVRQRVRERVLTGSAPRLAQYTGKGPLGAWVRVVALREHANEHRERLPGSGETGDEVLATSVVLSPELAALRSRYLALVNDAVRAGMQALTARQRTLFRLHYADGLSLDRIGAVFKVDKSTVSRWLTAARGEVLDAAKAHVAGKLGASHADAESLLELLKSQLDAGLSSVIAQHA